MDVPRLIAFVSVDIVALSLTFPRSRSSQKQFAASQDCEQNAVEGDDISHNERRDRVDRIGAKVGKA